MTDIGKKKIFLSIGAVVILLLIAFGNAVLADDNDLPPDYPIEQHKEWVKNNPDSLPIWLTPEELTRIDQIGRDFVPTEPPPAPVRQPAEFEPMQGALIRYPFGISYEIIAEMAEDVEVVTIVASTSQKNYVIFTISKPWSKPR